MKEQAYWILDKHTPVKCSSIVEWGKWFEDTKNRRVAQSSHGDVEVSTVFLGIDHNFGEGLPLLFETMIFGGKHDGETWRYSTWDKAEKGHLKACVLAFRELAALGKPIEEEEEDDAKTDPQVVEMKKTKKKRITFRQFIVRVRCKCAKWMWPHTGPISTFIAQGQMEFETPKFEFPDDWKEPLSLNKGDMVTIAPIFVSVDGVKHTCALVPCCGRPIKIYPPAPWKERTSEVIMR